MNYWWVNQNQTYKKEVAGGFLWSPKSNQNGNRNQFYENMRIVQPGDIVFSFCDAKIKAVGVAEGVCQTCPKPNEFGAAGRYWNSEGWYVPVNFIELGQPIRPKDYIEQIRDTLPTKYSPLQKNGDGNQGAYLAHVPDDMAQLLTKLLDGEVEAIKDQFSYFEVRDKEADKEEERIVKDTSISEPERKQIVNARRGQGIFRSQVELVEPNCRITRVSIKPFLIASHIKPWAQSTNREKIDGNNGLMLSPHVDRLFDRGYLSFTNDGQLILSNIMPSEVLLAWSIPEHIEKPKPFTDEQCIYLEYHRDILLRKSGKKLV